MKRLFFLLFLLSFVYEAYEYKLSITAITKDEHSYLLEWINYHLGVGVEHFYLYDNNDDDSTAKVLQPFVDAGIVELIPWPNHWTHLRFFDGCQLYAYRDALKKATGHTEWLAVIDTDEFIVPQKGKNLVKLIEKYYPKSNVIYVNWRLFGTSDQFIAPGEATLTRLVKCSSLSHPINKWGKTICRPEKIREINSPHLFKTKSKYYNGSGEIREGNVPAWDLMVLNHYSFRDENFFQNVKIPRHIKMWQLKESKKAVIAKLRQENEEYSVEEDYRILELVN